MKGVVFTEFLEMVEDRFGYEVVDHILSASDLKSDGAYTAVGTYEHGEMVQLVTHLSEKTNTPVPVLLKEYGKYIFDYFLKKYEAFFSPHQSTFDFLDSIEDHIHVEVKKLYPEAELPKIDTSRPDDNTMVMIYNSRRKMSDFAEGLIEKSMDHYGEKMNIHKEILEADGTRVKFTLTKEV